MKETEAFYLAAKIKSDIIFILMHLEEDNGCTKAEIAKDIRFIIRDIIQLESNLQDKIISD